MDKVRTKTRNTRNYSGRHIEEVCPPDKRVRPYIPPEPHYGMADGVDVRMYATNIPLKDKPSMPSKPYYVMSDGVPVTQYRKEPSGEVRHGFAYESTKRVHID